VANSYLCHMKRLSIYVSIILLSALLLLGSGGFTIGKMICGGNECLSTYSLGAAKDCCDSGNESEKSLSRSCCCELINVSYSLDDFSVSEKTNISAKEFEFFFSSSLPVFHFQSTLLRIPFSDTSPPSSQDYLHLIGSLLL